ncbi:MAG: GNAT family N-acetyltransferase [Prevotella sp.]|nr:GNAT family N-acetyltransferase [Prevotella sp.]
MNVADITVRAARRSEAPQIARLIMTAMTDECCLHFCGEGYGLDDFRQMMTLLVEHDASQYSWRNTLVAATADGRVVGIATAYDGARLHALRRTFVSYAQRYLGRDHSAMDDETQAGELYLDSLAVDPAYRRRGIASRLLEATARRAREMGIPQVGLLVDTANPAGERLYRSVGFSYAGDSRWGGHPMKHLVLSVDGPTR